MVLAAVMLSAVLSLFRLPAPGQFSPILELVVELSWPDQVIEPETAELPPPPLPVDEPAEATAPVEPAAESAPAKEVAESGQPADWEALRDEAIKEVLDAAEREQAYSVNPPFESARREAAVRFRASLAPAKKYPWDNVEKDQIGRTILKLGDGSCFQILEDPSAVNRWAFETFDKHFVYCTMNLGGTEGKELPWVEVIRQRYPYLRDPVLIP